MKRRWLLLLLVVVAALTLYTIFLQQAYTWRGNTHPDFFVEWTASHIALTGGNPYSEETTAIIQIGSKGHIIPDGEDQLAYVYPFYAVLVNAPLVYLPYDWASAIRQSVMQIALLASALLFMRTIRWQASPGELALVMLITVLSYPTFGGLMLGQMAVVVLALLLVAYWALRQEHDLIAGTCMALATVKPQLILLAVPGLLLWSLARRRWRVVASFALVLGALVAISFLIFPAWLQELVQAIMRYPSYKPTQTGPGFLLSECCGPVWAWLLGIAAAAGLLASWWAARSGKARWMDGAFALTMAMTCFLPPQTSPVDRMFLLPGVILLLRDASNWVIQAAIAVISIVGPWLAYAFLYRSHYNLNMVLPSLVVLLALGAWYLLGVRSHGTKARSSL